MKKTLLMTTAIVAITAIIFSGCSKDEENATPVVTLNGNETDTISLNTASYSDAGATANDAEDGLLIASSDFSSTNPDLNTAGTYEITYSATDANGNTGKAVRTVVVRNDAYYLAQSYYTTQNSISGPGTPFLQTITASTTLNNVVTFSKFGDYSGNSSITGKLLTVAGDKFVKINPSPQTANGIGLSGCNHVFTDTGNGTKVSQAAGKWTFTIMYKDENTGGGAGCTTSTVDYIDTFVQN